MQNAKNGLIPIKIASTHILLGCTIGILVKTLRKSVVILILMLKRYSKLILIGKYEIINIIAKRDVVHR